MYLQDKLGQLYFLMEKRIDSADMEIRPRGENNIKLKSISGKGTQSKVVLDKFTQSEQADCSTYEPGI